MGVWYVKRMAVAPRSDEDGAMAYVSKGPFPDRDSAREALVCLINNEIGAWLRRGMDASRDEDALWRVLAGEDNVVERGLRWCVHEVSG